jgi:lysophospholipase L1-like esterase
MRRAAAGPVASLLVCLLFACGEDSQEPSRGHEYDEYVALGDSFTSGGGLPRPVPDSGPCQQSRLSYPHLVAQDLGARLRDASCGGATTEHGTTAQARQGATSWPPQLDSLRPGTDLVTLGFGYNDLGFFPGLVLGCASLAATEPTGAPCQQRGDRNGLPDPATMPAQIGDRVEVLLDLVRDRAPAADVVVVGYPQLVPESGTCTALPLADGDYRFVRERLAALDDALRSAAEAAGATFVGVLDASEGHDICAGDEAWVAGAQPVPGTAAPYHPLAVGQRAMADLVLDALPG